MEDKKNAVSCDHDLQAVHTIHSWYMRWDNPHAHIYPGAISYTCGKTTEAAAQAPPSSRKLQPHILARGVTFEAYCCTECLRLALQDFDTGIF